MKKQTLSIVSTTLCLLLIFALAVGLTACGSGNAKELPAVGETVQLGGYDWRILEVKDGNALILSENILYRHSYHAPSDPISWEESGLRAHLNGEFYDSTFSAEEKKRIVETTVKNKDNPWFPEANETFPWYTMPGGNDTKDKVFLLSLDEMMQYFGDSGELAKGAGSGITYISDEFNDARLAQTTDGEVLWWWLRSPGLFYSACGANFCYAASITSFGGIGMEGELVENEAGGVRPALWLKL